MLFRSGDNLAKGISEVPALTFHANDDFSRSRFDDDPKRVHAELLAAARQYFGEGRVLESALKRWKYARPLVGHHGNCLPTEPIPGATLVFAGDAFGGAKIEGAALSGLAAAEAVLLAS